MEEDKAAALYEELQRKGGGAAKYKQGLGFSTDNDGHDPPARGSFLPSSSLMRSFVKASSPSKEKELERKSHVVKIQEKLKKKEPRKDFGGGGEGKVREKERERSDGRERERERRRSRSRSRERRRERGRSRSRSREKRRDKDRERGRSRSRSRERRRERERERERGRSRSRSKERSGRRSRSRSDEGRERRGRERRRSRSRSLSRERRVERRRDDGGREGRSERGRERKKEENGGVVDYAKLIDGYDKMTPAEKVKAKMKLQLSRTSEKDGTIGTGLGWERFDFDKDAPVDDEEMEAADDDAAVTKRINQSFRFSSLEEKRVDDIQAAHDEAMFGAPVRAQSPSSESEAEEENEKQETKTDDLASSLLNEKVLEKQQGSWRDRARRNVG